MQLQVKADHKNNLTTFIRYMIPGLISMMLLAAYGFTDTFVVGRRLGAAAVGAMGICTPVLTITYAFGFFFGMGGASLYAISLGQQTTKKASEFFNTAIFTALIVSVFATVILNLEIVPFANFLGADETNMNYVIPYLRVLLCYIPGFMLDVVLTCFIRNEGHPRIAMASIITGTLSNVVLDFVFVFGFDWGMFGAAFATALCQGFATIVSIAYLIFRKTNIKLDLGDIQLKRLPGIFANGFSSLVLEASSGFVTFFFIQQANNLYADIGAAIYTIIMNWALIIINLTLGIAQAPQPLISRAYGEGDIRSMVGYFRYSLIGSFVLCALFECIGFCCTHTMIGVFTPDDPTVIIEASKAFRLYLPAFILMDISICVGTYFQSINASLKSMIVMLFRGILFPILFIQTLPLAMASTGLWMAVPVSEMITSVIAAVMIYSEQIGRAHV